MSKFMDFLDNIDNDIVNETYVDETIVKDSKPVYKKKVVKKKPTTVKKDSSVKLIEARIRTKLDSIGLNESAISDVVSFVLEDIQKVRDAKPSNVKQSTSQKPTKQQVQEQQRTTTVMGRAESLLEGLPDNPTFDPLPTQSDSGSVAESNLSDVTSHASSLL